MEPSPKTYPELFIAVFAGFTVLSIYIWYLGYLLSKLLKDNK
jgi:hypothetical protein